MADEDNAHIVIGTINQIEIWTTTGLVRFFDGILQQQFISSLRINNITKTEWRDVPQVFYTPI